MTTIPATATATATVHEPWCTDHWWPDPALGAARGWCSRETLVAGEDGPLVCVNNSEGALEIELWQGNGDRRVTPTEDPCWWEDRVQPGTVDRGTTDAVLVIDDARDNLSGTAPQIASWHEPIPGRLVPTARRSDALLRRSGMD